MTPLFVSVPRRQAARRVVWLLSLLGLLASTCVPAAAAAITEADLLPVDQAFALSAVRSPDGIALHWKIADGYYLYRHRTSASSDAGFAAGPLQLPKGDAHDDEFFGKVETYRHSLDGTLPGQPRAPRATIKVKYQGCADAGICYPPQTRSISVALPAMAAPATGPARLGALDTTATASPATLGGNRLLGAPMAGVDAVPLPPEQAFGFEAIADDGNTLLLRFTPARGYYLYRDNTKFTLNAAAGASGIRLGKPAWPHGRAHRDEHFGNVTVYFDQIDVPLPLLRSKPGAAAIALTASFQGCQTDGICYPPMTRTVQVAVPRGTVSAPPGATTTPASDDAAAAAATNQAATGMLEPVAAADAAAVAAPTSGPETVASRNPATDDSARSAAPRASQLGLASALLLALLGGLVLNLMPCVLPVLSLKALSLVGNGQDTARARRHALWYTAGVMLSFAVLGALALGLRQAGLALGWGFQLQQPLVVALLALLMFALGLSLSGVWHAGGRWTGAGHGLATQSGPTGDFFTGVLAVVVATPCTAPFMGAALAWAFTASTGTAMAVFLALGLGLALPFLAIGFVPAFARLLPRPGAWMETFKQVLAFPLYLTAAWLAWVLARQRGADAIGWWLVAAITLAFAAWAWTRARMNGPRWLAAVAVLALFAAAWPLGVIHRLPRQTSATAVASPGDFAAVAFSEQRLSDLRASGRPVFVNITADWCVTCKANEKAVFARAGFREALVAANAVYMLGDWTDVDPALTAFLQRYKAVGVPLYVVFPAGGGEGQVLPSVLTPDIARTALAEAARTDR